MFDFCVKNSENSEKMKKGETMAMEKKQPNKYHKVGRINMTISKKAHIKCADIYISESHLTHISHVHGKELKQLGISAYDYVVNITKRFNQIRTGSGESILLVVFNDYLSHVAAIKMNYSFEKEYWEIKTAQPRKSKELEKHKLLWWNCPSSQ